MHTNPPARFELGFVAAIAALLAMLAASGVITLRRRRSA
jgi:hypothetical protein